MYWYWPFLLSMVVGCQSLMRLHCTCKVKFNNNLNRNKLSIQCYICCITYLVLYLYTSNTSHHPQTILNVSDLNQYLCKTLVWCIMCTTLVWSSKQIPAKTNKLILSWMSLTDQVLFFQMRMQGVQLILSAFLMTNMIAVMIILVIIKFKVKYKDVCCVIHMLCC